MADDLGSNWWEVDDDEENDDVNGITSGRKTVSQITRNSFRHTQKELFFQANLN